MLTQSRDEYVRRGFHRKQVGLNHIAFWAPSRSFVDRFYEQYLVPHRVRVLYGGPRDYPEYSKGYYAVYFEDPDKVKLELVTEPRISKS